MEYWIKRYNKLSLQLKVVIWFTFCNFLQRAISTITIPIYTRVLNGDEYGLSSVYNAYFTVIVIICTLYLHSGVMNNVFTKTNIKQEKVVSVFQSLSLVTTSCSFVIYLIFKDKIIELMGLPEIVTTAMFIMFIFWPPYNYWLIYKRYRYEYIMPVITSVLTSILTPIFGLTFVFSTNGNKGVARILGEIVFQCIIGLIFYIYNYKKSFSFYDSKLWRYAIKFNIPLIPSFLSEVMLNQSDRIMIGVYCGLTEAGIYSIAYSAASLIMMFSSALNAAFIPWQYQMLKKGEYAKLKRIGYLVLCILGGILILLVMFAPEVIKILAGESYAQGVVLIPVISAGIFLNIVSQLFYRVELYYEKQNKVFIAVCSSVIMKIILNMICLPIFGFEVAGYTTFIAYGLLCFLQFQIYKQICKESLDGKLIYKGREIIFLIIIIVACMFLVQFLYGWLWIRIFLSIVSFVVLFVFRKKMVKIVNEIKKVL